MRTIVLGGELGARFGTEYVLDVTTPAQASAALCRLVKGFREYVRNHPVGFHILVGERDLGEDELEAPCARVETITITPAIAGASSTMRIVAGAVITAIGIYTKQPGITAFGLSMMFGGIAEKLAPKPKLGDQKGDGTLSGYAFSGGVNTTGQGIGIKLSYGLGLSGTHILSAQTVAEAGVFYAYDELHGIAPPDDPGVNYEGPGMPGVGGYVPDSDNSNSYNQDTSWTWGNSEWSNTTPTGPDGSWSSEDYGDTDDSDY